ncbi:7dbc6d9e-d07a-4f50-947d-6ebab9d00036 [Thermothielavioides terrestris]|nr:7dbc6d9e-d07a-4f50-947d-6ebab9d00036 [Thermothielavioides terrestris]
MDKDKQG